MEAVTLPSAAHGDRRKLSRRQVLTGGAALGVLGPLGGCTSDAAANGRVAPDGLAVEQAAAQRRAASARVRQSTLTARAGPVDLGGRTVRTWSYGDGVPGPLLRGSAGEVLRVRVDNRLPQPTTVHWHGLAIRNDMDGVPNLTQPEIEPGAGMDYEFVLPTPGTYFYHAHHGVQRERGLYGPLIIDDPAEPGDYDNEFVVVLDDWTDGTAVGSGPEDILRYLQAGGFGAKYRAPVTAGEVPTAVAPDAPMGAPAPLVTQLAGDVQYPFHLLNGRLPTAPHTFTARPGRRARIRVINASGATVYRVALGDHRLTVTHSDGYPVQPVTVDTLRIASGERYDLAVTLGDGAFPLAAVAEGKGAQAMGVVRTASGATPPAGVQPAELGRRMLSLADLQALPEVRLDTPRPAGHDVYLTGDMSAYGWRINAETYDAADPFAGITPVPVRSGDHVRLTLINQTPAFHPMHLHGHTVQVRAIGTNRARYDARDGGGDSPLPAGARKDTVQVAPGQRIAVDFVADNPGQWLHHCHNAYHLAAGMAHIVSYQT
ncbi:MAG: multicopper oxidase domain-containing protein [Pseudonocardiaceae bacterium]|nr:multicopper oxidase domain-containing protein [Pseudonocardiaceae bacterium]